ncbi:uncharacterized transmembrane protein DDB_G0289901-like [Engraulis encrasicolus]|uniref:uncharacterized transmembrane protein DDB_G0289901-like n=1 Tax=Engraulis encrasicolus TaxID=184585 RepID=UPI002FD1FF82
MRHLLCLMLIWANLSATSASALSPSTGFVIVSRGGVIGLEGKAAVSTAVGAAAAAGDVAALLRSVKADYFLIDTVTGCIYGMVGGAVGGAKGGAVGAWKLSKATGDFLRGSEVGKLLGKLLGAAVGGVTGGVTGAVAGCVWGGEYGGKAGGQVGAVLGGTAGTVTKIVFDPITFLEIAAKCLNDAIDENKFCVDWKDMVDALEEGGQTGAETGREWEERAKKTYH